MKRWDTPAVLSCASFFTQFHCSHRRATEATTVPLLYESPDPPYGPQILMVQRIKICTDSNAELCLGDLSCFCGFYMCLLRKLCDLAKWSYPAQKIMMRYCVLTEMRGLRDKLVRMRRGGRYPGPVEPSALSHHASIQPRAFQSPLREFSESATGRTEV